MKHKLSVTISFASGLINKAWQKFLTSLYTGPDESPYWAIVGRDNISIMLKEIAPDVKPVPNHTLHDWAPCDAYISTTEPDQLFEEYLSNNVAFSKPIHNNSDDLRGF